MQRIEFNLQSALDGAKLVTGSGLEAEFVEYDRFNHLYPLKVTICGISECYTDNGKYSITRDIPNLDLFLAVPYTDIIGNSITEPMMSAHDWYAMMGDLTTDKGKEWLNSALNSGFMYVVQQYGNYVADFITKNK